MLNGDATSSSSSSPSELSATVLNTSSSSSKSSSSSSSLLSPTEDDSTVLLNSPWDSGQLLVFTSALAALSVRLADFPFFVILVASVSLTSSSFSIPLLVPCPSLLISLLSLSVSCPTFSLMSVSSSFAPTSWTVTFSTSTKVARLASPLMLSKREFIL